VIDPGVAETIEELRQARNVAVHEETYTVDPRDAAYYVRLTEGVATFLEALRTG
jgi:hypothetical protein